MQAAPPREIIAALAELVSIGTASASRRSIRAARFRLQPRPMTRAIGRGAHCSLRRNGRNGYTALESV